jgi:hypothetical protein
VAKLNRFKAYGLRAEIVADTEITRLIERLLSERTDPLRVRRVVGDLREGRAFSKVFNAASKRLETLLADLPRMTLEQTARRRGRFGHLFEFPDDARVYLRQTDELRALVTGPAAKDLLKVPEGRRILEEHARVLSLQVAGVVDRYSALSSETGLFNGIVQLLYPEDYASLRLDSHHVAEERTYTRFRADWELLGWKSPLDMATIAVPYEYHIRSPKRLPGIDQIGKDLDARSLTQELLKHIDVNGYRDVFDLLEAYKGFYNRNGLRRALPVLDAIENELARRRSVRKIIREVKK